MRHFFRATMVAIMTYLTLLFVPTGTARALSDNDPVFTQRLQNHYGAPIAVDLAQTLTKAAIEEGRKNGWTLAVAVVDPGGGLVYFERMDGTQSASPEIAIEKARAAVAFRRSTKLLEDRVAAGRLQYLRLPLAMPIEGGLPIVVGDLIVGGIAVSGADSVQDGVAARAAMVALEETLRGRAR